MASVEDFVRSPSEDLLEQCTKEQLLKIAEHFQISDKRLKETIKHTLKGRLLEEGILVMKLTISL